jgi:hypothetical protein
VLGRELAHVEADVGALVAEQQARDRLGQLGRWVRDLLRFLPLKSQFVLSGNARDRFPRLGPEAELTILPWLFEWFPHVVFLLVATSAGADCV